MSVSQEPWFCTKNWSTVAVGSHIKLVPVSGEPIIGVLSENTEKFLTVDGAKFSKYEPGWRLYTHDARKLELPDEYGTVFTIIYSDYNKETYFTAKAEPGPHYILVSDTDEEVPSSKRLVRTVEELQCCVQPDTTIIVRSSFSD